MKHRCSLPPIVWPKRVAFHRGTIGAQGLRHARSLVPQLRQLLTDIGPEIDPRETVSAGLARFTAKHVAVTLKPSTQATYAEAFRRLTATLGDLRLVELTTDRLRAYLNTLPRGSQVPHFCALSSAFNWLGLAGVMPAKRPRGRVRQAWLDKAGLRHWVAALGLAEAKHWARRRTIDALLVGTLVPFRRGELASLRWEECDLGLRVATLHDSKTGARWIPLGRLGASVIASQPRTNAFVFTPPRRCPSSHITATSISHAFCKIARRYREHTGHRWPHGLCFHSLRHTWASLALVTGEPTEIVRRIMGHSSAHMLARYSHVLGEALRATADKVQARVVDGLQLQMAVVHS